MLLHVSLMLIDALCGSQEVLSWLYILWQTLTHKLWKHSTIISIIQKSPLCWYTSRYPSYITTIIICFAFLIPSKTKIVVLQLKRWIKLWNRNLLIFISIAHIFGHILRIERVISKFLTSCGWSFRLNFNISRSKHSMLSGADHYANFWFWSIKICSIAQTGSAPYCAVSFYVVALYCCCKARKTSKQHAEVFTLTRGTPIKVAMKRSSNLCIKTLFKVVARHRCFYLDYWSSKMTYSQVWLKGKGTKMLM